MNKKLADTSPEPRQLEGLAWVFDRLAAMGPAEISFRFGEQFKRGISRFLHPNISNLVILTLIWLLAAPWLIWPLWRQRRLAVLAVGCTILVGTLTPHSVKLGQRHLLPDSIVQVTTYQALTTQKEVPSATPVQKSGDPAKSISAGVAKSTVQTSSKPIGENWRGAHKLGNVGFFALLAFVGGWRWPRQSWRRRVFCSSFSRWRPRPCSY